VTALSDRLWTGAQGAPVKGRLRFSEEKFLSKKLTVPPSQISAAISKLKQNINKAMSK